MLRNNALFLEKATEENSPGAYKRINTHTLQSFENTILSRNLDQNMLENALQRWGLRPQTSGGWFRLQTFVKNPLPCIVKIETTTY